MLNQALLSLILHKFDRNANSVLNKIKKINNKSTNELVEYSTCETEASIELIASLCILSQRTLGLMPYKHQIQGLLAVSKGYSLNMFTGEGKTLICTLGAIVLLKSRDKVKVCTANDYLSKRDYRFSKPLLDLLGISSSETPSRTASIQYSPIQTFIMSWLQDASATSLNTMTHVGFNNGSEKHAIIIDEIDSTLIESSGITYTTASTSQTNHEIAKLAYSVAKKSLTLYPKIVERKEHSVDLAEEHFDLLERTLKEMGISATLSDDSSTFYFQIKASLLAITALEKGTDYTVLKNKIQRLNKSNGRADKRTFNDMVLNALQIKESVRVTEKNCKFAISSLQNYVKRYATIVGMSGTASINALELKHTYGIRVINIKRRVESLLLHEGYTLFPTIEEKLSHTANKILEYAGTNPILVVTQNESEVEKLSNMLPRHLTTQTLTSRNMEDEGKVIANAGKPKNITITTRVCSRGADIEVNDDNMLIVIATSVGETCVDDSQLSGRTARNGKKGLCMFFCSAEDSFFARLSKKKPEVIVKFCSDINADQGEAESTKRALTWVIKNEQRISLAQKRNARKQLMYFDEPISNQLDVLLSKRIQILTNDTSLASLTDNLNRTNIDEKDLVIISRDIAIDSLDEAWRPHINNLIDNRTELFDLGTEGIRRYKSSSTQLLEDFVHSYQSKLNINVQKHLEMLM